MKLFPIVCFYLLFAQWCLAQPVSWFASAGVGMTQLHSYRFSSNQLTHSGKMAIVMGGVDLYLQENLRSRIRATLSIYKALFRTSQITDLYRQEILDSYTIHMNSITPEISFLYNIVNNKLKIYMGAGLDLNFCWSDGRIYKSENLTTGQIYSFREPPVELISEWPSYNVKAGIMLGHWELGATGYIRGIVASGSTEMLNGDLYFIWLGFHFSKKALIKPTLQK